jgi:hypothetical protein
MLERIIEGTRGAENEESSWGYTSHSLGWGLFAYWRYSYIEPVPKPALWGLSDPPVIGNMSWTKEGAVETLWEENHSVPQLYGEVIGQLQDLGYSLEEGNWSRTDCQWSLWDNGRRAYYVAYNGTKFLAIRGKLQDVVNATKERWLCGRPSGSRVIATPSPWKEAEILAITMGKELMDANVSVKPEEWRGPLPDWYLAKFSFEAKTGGGVDILILIYSAEDQVKYAKYQLMKRERNLKLLESDAGQYRALIVLKGNPKGVESVLSIILGPTKEGR